MHVRHISYIRGSRVFGQVFVVIITIKWKQIISHNAQNVSENLSDTFTKSLSQVDADRCDWCMNFFMRHVGSGRHRKQETT